MQCCVQSLQGGKYKIDTVLGTGGFANTYLATVAEDGSKVAIKEFFMKEYCGRDESTSQVQIPTEGGREIVERYKQKFLKEARMISSLVHKHVIRIHDVFEENGTAYYVMDYIERGSLKDKVSNGGAVSEKLALRYIRQVADALSYVHSNNILHLDVKPANVLLDGNDDAVLIDFGISKHYDADGGETSTTPAGVSKGYAPIEQYQHGSVSGFTPSTDVYSLGATLFYLITGEAPPEASVVYEEGLSPSLDAYAPAIKAAIEKAMSPRRKDRYQTIAEFVQALPDVVQEQATEGTQPNIDDEETTIIGTDHVSSESKAAPKKETSRPSYLKFDEEEEKIGGWMAFFLWVGIGLGLVVSTVRVFSQLFDQATGRITDFLSVLYLALFVLIGVKAIVAFYRKKENAVPLAMTYCIMVALDAFGILGVSLVSGQSGPWFLVFRNILWACIWVSYLCLSEDVKERFPKHERKWRPMEKIVLSGVTALLIAVVASAVNAPKPPDPAQELAVALKTGDYAKVKQLADRSYSPAYIPLAKHYIESKSTYDLAEKYAEKAKKAGVKGAQEMLDKIMKLKKGPDPDPDPDPDPNASKLQRALESKDYVAVRKLADDGYSPAYLPMAEYYVKTPSTHDLADKYAQKAKKAGIKGAQKVIDDLQSMGYYE